MIRPILLAAALLLVIVYSPSVDAARAPVTGKIDRVLMTDPDQFGGCLIRLTTDIPGTLACNNKRWVTLDCAANFPESGKDVAYKKLELATLATALGSTTFIQVDDSRTVNVDYCYARQVQFMPPPASP